MSTAFTNPPFGRHPDSWYAATTKDGPGFAPLDRDIACDICVVGGGYTGLSAALHLAQAGLNVVLVEAHVVGYGASGRNGGQVGSGQRLDQDALARTQGAADAHHLWALAQEAKALTARLIRDHDIDAALRPGIANVVRSARDLAMAHAYAERLARDYGYDQITPLDRAATAALIGSDAFAGGTLDHGGAHLHPLRYAHGLARAAHAAGARIFEHSTVAHIDGTTLRLAAGHTIRADQVVLACNGYLGGLQPHVARRVMPINNFIVATEPLGADAAHILPDDIAVADDRFVVNYWRRSEDGRLLFGGGESYGKRFPRDIAAKVRGPMRAIYPGLADIAIEYAWGGTLAITMKRMPLFARPRPGIWSASGYSGHGVALATLAGRILADATQGERRDFDVMARIPIAPFPGGRALGSPILALAMTWFALRDRIGI